MNISIKTEFIENIEETYVVSVTFNNRNYSVNCQTYLDHDYNETWELSCTNDSGGDIYDSGLARALFEQFGEDFEYSDEFTEIQNQITECAESHKTENNLEAVLNDKHDIDAKSIKSLFNAFCASDCMLYLVEHTNSDEVTVIIHDVTKIADALKILRTFDSVEAWEKFESNLWFNEWCADGYHDYNIAYAHFVAKNLGAFDE